VFSAEVTAANAMFDLKKTQDFFMRTAPLWLGRCIAVLDDVGRPAKVPPASEPGDVVFVPLGSAIPFVLRPAAMMASGDFDDSIPCFRFLGECYVHGAMNGEMMEKLVKTVVLI